MVPRELLASTDSRKTVRGKMYIAWAGTAWTYPTPLRFESHELEGAEIAGTGMWMSHTKWEDVRWDYETSFSAASPRDMIVGFQWLSTTPMFRDKCEEALARLRRAEWKGEPSFTTLRQLKANDLINEGMWVVCVRLPRAVGARYMPPYARRRDVLKLLIEMDRGGEREKIASGALATVRASTDEHPLDGDLRKLKNGTLVCKVASHVTCARCSAIGNHSTLMHDDMVDAQYQVDVITEDIPWLKVKDLEAEVLPLPQVLEGGFQVQIRSITAKIPLRLARAMKLRKLDVEGAVHACGVAGVEKPVAMQFNEEALLLAMIEQLE